MNELNEWASQISNFEKLRLADAKRLYLKAINESDETLKKEYFDRLINGTLYVVYNYIKKQNFELFQSSAYDMNDVINSFNELWINIIYSGEIINVDRYSLLFTTTITNKLYESLCNNQTTLNERFLVSYDCIKECFIEFIESRKKGKFYDFNKVIEQYYQGEYCYDYAYNTIILILPIFESIIKYVDIDRLKPSKINKYFKFIFDIGLSESLKDNMPDEIDIEERTILKLLNEEFIREVDLSIKKDKQRQVIHERFGLDDNNPLSLKEVGKIHDITSERVRQIEIKALRRIGYNKKIKRFKEDYNI